MQNWCKLASEIFSGQQSWHNRVHSAFSEDYGPQNHVFFSVGNCLKSEKYPIVHSGSSCWLFWSVRLLHIWLLWQKWCCLSVMMKPKCFITSFTQFFFFEYIRKCNYLPSSYIGYPRSSCKSNAQWKYEMVSFQTQLFSKK